MINYDGLPQTLKDFIFYLEVVLGKSKTTTYEYLLDLQNFFRYMKVRKQNLPSQTKLHEVAIHELDIPFVASITLEDIYDYFYFCRENDCTENVYPSRLFPLYDPKDASSTIQSDGKRADPFPIQDVAKVSFFGRKYGIAGRSSEKPPRLCDLNAVFKLRNAACRTCIS